MTSSVEVSFLGVDPKNPLPMPDTPTETWLVRNPA